MSKGDAGRGTGPTHPGPLPAARLLALADQDAIKDVPQIVHGVRSFPPGCTAVRPQDVRDLAGRTHPGKLVGKGFVAKTQA